MTTYAKILKHFELSLKEKKSLHERVVKTEVKTIKTRKNEKTKK